MDDVHFAVHAPFRPRFAFTQIDDARVRFVKLNVEIAQNCIPKPGDVGRRSPHQFVVRTEPMLIDELLEIRLRYQLRRWVPDKFAAELKFTHAKIVRRSKDAGKQRIG